MLRFYPESTKVVFFDLEYFVPASDRKRASPSGMFFSPLRPGHKILGGTFVTYYPMEDRLEPPIKIWEWSTGSEIDVLRKIFGLLEFEWKKIEHKPELASIMLSGIGISHSDIPALLVKLTSNNVSTAERIYDLLCGCRQIDLSVATYSQFSLNNGYFAYPKSKSQLYQKYLNGKQMDSGMSVWEMYEMENFSSIEKRSLEEIHDVISIYKAIFDLKNKTDGALRRLKRFEKAEKNSEGGRDGI